MDTLLKVPAQISKVETTADKCLKLIVHTTQELPADEEAKIFQLKQQIGWFVFSVTDIKESDIPDEPVEFEGQKTPSERLRNVLFLVHQSQGGKPEDFEAFRIKYMEGLISRLKEKLN